MQTTQVRIEGEHIDAHLDITDLSEIFNLIDFMLVNFKSSTEGFQVDFYSGLKPLETFIIQSYPPYGVFIQYAFLEERPFLKNIGRQFITFETAKKDSIYDPYTEWERVYEYNYLPVDKAINILRDFSKNGLDVLANYTWDSSIPEQSGSD